MTRLAVSMALLLTGLTAHAASADEPPSDDTIAAAAQAGVRVSDLQDALATLADAGLPTDAFSYLRSVGELPTPVARPVAAPVIPDVWARLADCESHGNWQAISDNGLYFGGLQEDLRFWRNYGGTAYAARPDLATPAAQIAVAIRGQAAQGWGSWPVCSRRIGLR